MKRNFASRILHRMGWTYSIDILLPDKCVICVAPHTSNWDFVYGLLFKYSAGLTANFFMKKEWFRFPLGGIMKKLGGIPVNRKKSGKMTDAVASEFANYPIIRIAVTPEGTRSLNRQWKKGFYHIASKAGVPIVLASLDYKTKKICFGELINPSGNIEEDMLIIKKYYADITAKYPQKFGY